MHTILFVGGGSVGHIAPSVAVWRVLQTSTKNLQAHFVCAKRQEDESFLSNENLAFTPIIAPKFSLSFLWKFPAAVQESHKLLRTQKPDVIFSKGGYVSVPLCIAAAWQKIPIVLHESDAVSGRANRIVGRFAAHICLGFPGATGKNATFTGNPVRADIAKGSAAEGRKITGFTGKRPVLLVMGGSQGAQAINRAIDTMIPALTQMFDIIHLRGYGKGDERNERHYWARPFVQEELQHLYAITDIAISRAGAGSIAELAVNQIPTVLVPLRGVGHDHQQKNAEQIAAANACLLLQQAELKQRLPDTLKKLQDRTYTAAMTEKFAAFGNPEAAQKIGSCILHHIAK